MDNVKHALMRVYSKLQKKNGDYGNENINILGLKGCYVRISDKTQRLKQLVWDEKEKQVEDETVEDTLLDLAGYAIISYLLLKNQWGKSNTFKQGELRE